MIFDLRLGHTYEKFFPAFFIKLLFTGFLYAFMIPAGDAQHCLAQKLLNDQVASHNNVAGYRAELENQTLDWIENSRQTISFRDLQTIEVVVHVVWNQPDEMISEEQVLSQIEVLNEDYRMLNASLNLVTFPLFLDVAADLEIEFKLAEVDPSGNPTNGIHYVHTDIPNIASKYSAGMRRICHEDLGGADAWCYHNYLNIWVGGFDGGVIGEASFPGQEINHPEEDGIRIAPGVFGRTPNLQQPYHLGRTLTHEVGHFFNLLHPWGESNEEPPNLDCTGDDGVTDTPKQAFSYKNTCFSTIHQSCGTPDMHFNFMNYTDDACMAMFTLGQKLRVLAAIQLSRSALLNPSGCSVSTQNLTWPAGVKMFPNPVVDELQINLPSEVMNELTLDIFDVSGQRIFGNILLKTGNNRVSLGNLKNGLYIVKISTDEYFGIEKIAVLR